MCVAEIQTCGGCQCDNSRPSNEKMIITSAELADDLRLITEIPDLCDVRFLVGENAEVMYGVKAVLITRCSYFKQLLSSHTGCSENGNKKSISSKIKQWIRKDRSRRQTERIRTLRMTVFKPRVFRKVISYLHTGRIDLDISSVIGVLAISEEFGLKKLVTVCEDFAGKLLKMRTVLSLLNNTEPYQERKAVNSFIERCLHFVSKNAQNMLRLPQFEHVTRYVAQSVLTRRDLLATEEIKWDAALRWSRRHCKGQRLDVFRETIKTVISTVDFGLIPIRKLTCEIQPLHVFPAELITKAVNAQRQSFNVADSNAERHESEENDMLYTGAFGYVNKNDLLDEMLEEESRLMSILDQSTD